ILKHFTKRKGNILKLKWNNLKFKKTSLYIFIIGLFPFLFFLTQRFYDIGINYLVNFNNEQLISIGIIKRSLYSPVLTILSALAWLRPIFAYNYIKNNFVRIKKLFLYCTLILFLILIVVFIPLVFTKKIINLFTHDFAKISIAKKLIKNYIFITPLILFKTIIFVYLQSTSKKLKLALIYLSNILLIIIPLYLIWRFHLEIGFDGWLYLNNTIAFLMFIVSLIFFIIEFKKLNSKPQDREDDENCIKKKLLNVT
ncbi:MAG: MATE family efflux transporter, partial [Halanaerobiales bacterium]